MVKYITIGCDFFFNTLGFGAHEGKNAYNFQLFLCLMNVTLSAWPIVCYIIYTSDIHVVLWLGSTPQYVNLMVPLVLLVLNIGVNVFQMCHYTGQCARVGCFTLFLVLGALLLAAGGFVFVQAEAKAAELIDACGSTPLPRKIELEWQKLNRFYQECSPERKVDIVQCPGFSKQFPNRVFVDYIESLEYEFNCVGFCKFWAKPLFNQNADLATRCATSIGEHVGSIAWSVGAPTAAIGVALVTIGSLLSGYDHL